MDYLVTVTFVEDGKPIHKSVKTQSVNTVQALRTALVKLDLWAGNHHKVMTTSISRIKKDE